MDNLVEKSQIFDNNGWRLPNGIYETFSDQPKWFFKLGEDLPEDKLAIDRIDKYKNINRKNDALEGLSRLNNKINNNIFIKNINNGIKVPFVIKKIDVDDIGKFLEEILLEKVSKSFTDFFPESHFKAVIQDKTDLINKLSPSVNSGYKEFLNKLSKSDICGYYFPQVLQEYSVDSQILQMKEINKVPNLCLSGPLEVATSLIGTPNLLISKTHYSPVLCLSGVTHIDERLICCFKSYGRHLEFWCLSQMLSKNKKQVSEQWSGGLSVFTEY
ncbi:MULTISPECIES: hypothetical protein [Prochlorococcus]|uniref:Uncharacterized protein n=1 Tax=Prochlorococcus marinus str. MIT 9314 TaxID=167548 RepID=A0A0A2AEJ6_PROMR|nr:hypothetical protein [Prochlorococcus marinus]KGG00303.1 hypothetical protein EU98_1835 [Prochlorococcus marinus str. MIT 9314]